MKRNFEPKTLQSCGIPSNCISFLEQCIVNLSSFSKSIYLTGSWALQEAEITSDIDILTIVDNESDKTSVLGILKKYDTKTKNRRKIDAKAIMESEIRGLVKLKNRFYYWNQIHSGILLFGNEFNTKLGIDESTMGELFGELLQTHNDICANLESNLMFSGTAAMLYETVKTLYYVERYFGFFGAKKTRKNLFIGEILGESYHIARKCYYNAISTSPGQIELKFLMKKDSKFKAKDYNNLLETAIAFTSHLLEDKNKISKCY